MLQAYIDKKLKFGLLVVFCSAVLCGLIMGLVSQFSIVLAQVTQNKMLGRAIYAVSFTALLFLVLMNGYELFTGNTMLLTAVHKRQHTKKILLNLLLVYVGNFLGCLTAAALLYACKLHETFALAGYLQTLYDTKTGLSADKMLLLGFLCNYLVCMGVYLGGKGKTSVETYLNLFFPIAIFVFLGLEHSVANMYSLFYAAMVTGSPAGPAFLNLLLVTAGNIAGGVCFAFTTKVKDRVLPAVTAGPVSGDGGDGNVGDGGTRDSGK